MTYLSNDAVCRVKILTPVDLRTAVYRDLDLSGTSQEPARQSAPACRRKDCRILMPAGAGIAAASLGAHRTPKSREFVFADLLDKRRALHAQELRRFGDDTVGCLHGLTDQILFE